MSISAFNEHYCEVRERNRACLSQARVHFASVSALLDAQALRESVATLNQQPPATVTQIVNNEPLHEPPGFLPESPLAHQLLDGLSGLEIGAAAHNAFGLNTKNVGISAEMEPHDFEVYKQHQIAFCRTYAPIDIPGYADAIPVDDSTQDFVLHSHVWEHLPNPLRALEEWVRVARPGGYIYAIVPKRDAADAGRDITPIDTSILHYLLDSSADVRAILEDAPSRGHYTVFDGDSLTDIETWFNLYHRDAQLRRVAYQETDDKVGNGHAIVWQVVKRAPGEEPETQNQMMETGASFDRLADELVVYLHESIQFGSRAPGIRRTTQRSGSSWREFSTRASAARPALASLARVLVGHLKMTHRADTSEPHAPAQ